MEWYDVLSCTVGLTISVVFVLIFVFGMIPDKIFGKKEKQNLESENFKLKHQNSDLNQEIEKLKSATTSLTATLNKLKSENASLRKKLDDIDKENILQSNQNLISLDKMIRDKQAQLSALTTIHNDSGNLAVVVRQTFKREYNIDSFFDSITANRLNNAFNSNLIINNLNFSATVRSGNNKYNVSLTSCSCKDFTINNRKNGAYSRPCKHIIYLAYSLNLLQNYHQECNSYIISNLEELNQKTTEAQNLSEEVTYLKQKVNYLSQKRDAHEKALKECEQILDDMTKNKCEGYPQLAGIEADMATIYYGQAAEYLRQKIRPAPKEAMRIEELRRDTIAIRKERNVATYKLEYIEKLYPKIKQLFDKDFDVEKKPSLSIEIKEITDEA